MAEAGARLAIRLLQEAAERGDIDPWDVDVIAVVDGFLDQLRQRVSLPRLVAAAGGSYEKDLAESSEAFLAASVLVGLKAEMLEVATFQSESLCEDAFDAEDAGAGFGEGLLELPQRPETHLRRRPVAPPPLQRPVTLGELIRQLEDIAERLEEEEGRSRRRQRPKRFSERAAIAQVSALAHREKLPETTAALSLFLRNWEPADSWVDFEELVRHWAAAAPAGEGGCGGEEDLDRDRVGVFWALLFLCSQGRVELLQEGGLFGPLRLRRALEGAELPASLVSQGSDGGPARHLLAA